MRNYPKRRPEGDGAGSGAGAPPAGGTPPAGPPAGGPAGDPKPDRTFTQADVDAIVQERLRRAVPADYEDLKTKAGRLEEIEAATKTDLEKARDAEKKARDEGARAIATANARLIRAEIISEAAAAGAVDPETVVALLSGSDAVTVEDDGSVKGAKQAVKKLLEDKPFLAKAAGPPPRNGGEFNGNDPKAVADKIRELEQKLMTTTGTERRQTQQELTRLKTQQALRA